MARKIAYSTLNASGQDIMNVIRANASYEYQQYIPEVNKLNDMVAVGERIMGYPAMANQFLNALINRIAAVIVNSHTFKNVFAPLKKRDLRLGETVEEVFVGMAKAREFSAEKAEARELKRTLPDVRAAFHLCNVDMQYAVTIQNRDLARAFLTDEGLDDLIARIVDSIYRGLEYDEYQIFKYLIIMGFNNGEIYQKTITSGLGADALHDAAIAFRATSNQMLFVNTEFNAAGVHTNTPREDQVILMDAEFAAAFDVSVLAAAFNMDKADFMGRLILIDSFQTFDNERFSAIVDATDAMEEVTDAELTAMAPVKAIIADKEYFQYYKYAYQTAFDEKYVAAGQYWNYFYRYSAIAGTSPFSNAVAIVAGS